MKILKILAGPLLTIGSLLFVFILCEGVARIVAYQKGQGQSISQSLAKSAQRTPPQALGNVSLSGLVQASQHPEIIYELKPNSSGTFQGENFAVNSVGMRSDREFELVKPQGVQRIVGLGDSVMFGWGVPLAATYLARLEQSLNRAAAGKYEVLNFGVPGYNTAMEVATFEKKALTYDPDIVVLHFINNDFGVPYFMLAQPSIFGLQHSFLWDEISARLSTVSAARKLLSFSLEGMSGAQQQDVLDQYKYMTGMDGVRAALAKLAALCAPKHIPILVIIGKLNVGDRKRLAASINALGMHEVPVRSFQLVKLKQLGEEDTAENRRKVFTLFPKDDHPNAVGHEVYAQAIGAKLAEVARGQRAP